LRRMVVWGLVVHGPADYRLREIAARRPKRRDLERLFNVVD
jgi:hypothetical protein